MDSNLRLSLLAVLTIIALVMTGCPQEGEENEAKPTKFPSEFWGEWIGIYMDTMVTITSPRSFYLSSDGFDLRPIDYDLDRITPEKVSERVIKATLYPWGDKSYPIYLFPKRTASAYFTGNIVGFDSDIPLSSSSTNRSISGLGGIQVTISNLNDKAQEYNLTTDKDGNFTTVDTIPGEPYHVNAGGETVEIISPDNGGDVGTVTITDGLNFKANINLSIPEKYYSNVDNNAYLNRKFNAEVKIKNVGNMIANAVTYKATLDEGLHLHSGSLAGILGSIAPNKEASFSLNLSCDSINGEKSFKKIFLQIHDPISNKTWTDSVSILVYRENLTLGVISQKQVWAIIITPRDESAVYTVSSSYKACYLSFPRMTGDYIIAVYPIYTRSDKYQTVYKLYFGDKDVRKNDYGFPAEASSFIDAGNFEPNDTEYSAALITDDTMSYLHTNDADYFKLHIE